jgi:sn-glycerol 3-phosphate transport system substrate-binding protein
MSRLWALIGIAVLALALAACGGGEEAAEESPAAGATSPTASAGTVTIDFWHSELASAEEALKKLIDRFNASQDEVRVNLVFQGTYPELMLKLLASLPSGNVPALVELADLDTQLAIDSGGATPVQRFIDAEGYDLSDFNENALAYYSVGDELYAMPLGILVPLLYYNKVDFREVGLDPDQPPLTIEEMRDYSEKLYQEDGAGNVVRSGIALDMQAWFLELALAGRGDLYVNEGNGREGRATEALFDDETGRTFLRWWDEMIDSGLALNVGRNPSFAESLLAVGAGSASMAFAGSSALRSAIDVVEAGLEGVELGIGPYPSVAGGVGSPGVFGRSLWIMGSRPEEEQEAAWKVIRWLAEPEQEAELFAGSGFLPVRLSAYEEDASQQILEAYPQYQVAVDSFMAMPSTLAALGPRMGPFTEVREIVTQAIEEIVLSGKDPEEALAEAASRATEELQDYNRRVE